MTSSIPGHSLLDAPFHRCQGFFVRKTSASAKAMVDKPKDKMAGQVNYVVLTHYYPDFTKSG